MLRESHHGGAIQFYRISPLTLPCLDFGGEIFNPGIGRVIAAANAAKFLLSIAKIAGACKCECEPVNIGTITQYRALCDGLAEKSDGVAATDTHHAQFCLCEAVVLAVRNASLAFATHLVNAILHVGDAFRRERMCTQIARCFAVIVAIG